MRFTIEFRMVDNRFTIESHHDTSTVVRISTGVFEAVSGTLTVTEVEAII